MQIPQPTAAVNTQKTPSEEGQAPGWYYARDGKKGGPVSFNQLQKFAAAGKLRSTDHVILSGGAAWQTAGSLPELFGNNPFVAATPAPPPPTAAPSAVSVPPMAIPVAATGQPNPNPQTINGLPRPVVLVLVFGGMASFLLLGLVVALVCFNSGGTSTNAPSSSDDSRENISPQNPQIPLSPRQKKINSTIDRGVVYLRKRLADGGRFYSMGDQEGGAHPGAVALLGLTLLECNASPQDADVQEAARQVRQSAPNLRFTYSIALAVLFLERLHSDPKGRPDSGDAQRIKTLALRLIASQNRKGGWDYFCRLLAEQEERDLLEALKADRYQAGDFHRNTNLLGRDDNSIGQFVTLALWASRKQNVPVRGPLLAVERRYRERQRFDGSWSYNDFNPFLRDTSTCAALIGLAVGRGVRDDQKGGAQDLLRDETVTKGLRHLQEVVGTKRRVSDEARVRKQEHTSGMERIMVALERSKDPFEQQQLALQMLAFDKAPELRGMFFDGDNWGDLYFLWSLERMAVIYDLKKVGEVDWHEWGTDLILEHQHADGSWQERFPGVPDTCFALLFLRRANLVKDLTDKLQDLLVGSAVQTQPKRRD